EEWVRLFAIDDIKGDLTTPGYSNPLTVDFLKANPYLVLDTRHFGEDFKRRLLASFDDLDEQCDGLLLHSENFQALNLLMDRYRGKVECVHI
ncbi:site-specific DNA-methyltransferase, partial [Escherichia coli]|nr:site-specific DNA-methyltransferase [Escherichia coli]